MKQGWWVAAIVAVATVALVQGNPAFGQSAKSEAISEKNPRTLTIGRVTGNPRKHAARLLALGQHIVANHDAFDDVAVVLKHKPEEMFEASARGEIDIVSETVFAALQIEASGQMEMALLEWKDNVRSYHSVVLVRKESPFQKLEDLRGARIAFEDPGSTSGFFLPYVEIMDAGLDMIPDASGKASPEHVRYLFGGAEINVVGSLIGGGVDAAAISNLDMDDDKVVTGRFRDELRVLHQTRNVPRSIMLMRSSLPQSIRDDLKTILLDMHLSNTGRSTLRKYFKIKQFEDFSGAVHNEFNWVRGAFDSHHVR